MGPFFTMIAIVIGAIILGNYAKKLSDGGFTPSELARMRSMATSLVLLVVVLAFVGNAITTVAVGDQVVLFNRLNGKFTAKPLGSGWHLVMPGIYERRTYDVRTLIYTMSATEGEGNIAQKDDAIRVKSSDGLDMDIDLTVQYKIDPSKLNTLHMEIGEDYTGKIIRPAVREAIRNVFARHEATAAYSTERDMIKGELFDDLSEALTKNYIILEEVRVRDIGLPDSLVARIEEKKAAQQDAERMEYVLMKAESEKQQVLIEANAQAEKIQILNDALSRNPDYLKWLAIDKLNDDIRLVVTDGNTLLNLDALDKTQP